MTTASDWFDADERVFAARHQAALLLDLLLSQGHSSHRVLRGTGLFEEDLVNGEVLISARQLLQLVANARYLDSDGELAFRWGARLWPGHYGVFSSLLGNAASLEDALELLCRYRRQLSPLLAPHLIRDSRFIYVQWIDSHGAGDELGFLVNAHMAGLSAMVRWLSGMHPQWRYLMTATRPQEDACSQVYLGEHRHFGVGVNLMLTERQHLQQPWPRHVALARRVAEQEAEARNRGLAQSGFPEAVYRYLVSVIQQPVNLPMTADAFGMSPATLKRRLGKQGCHFQQLQDQARLHVGLYLLHVKGWNNEQVAQHLCFNDTTNFRRAFKRWCGLTPSDSRSRLVLPVLSL